MATPLKIEHRCVIKFCVNANMTPTDTLKFMQKADSNVSRSLVFGWHKKFRDGLEDVSDRPRTGRPGRSEQDVRRIRDAISEDRRRSVREISDMTGICVNVVYRTLTETLNMNKVCARWVPRLLQQDQKAARVRLSRSFLNRYDREGDQFLHRVVTMDETWLYLYEPESKQQSMVWKHPGSPPPKKARTCKSSGKFMFMFFMDAHGLILQHAVPQGITVNAAYYQKV
jgi:Transposase (partial DDE domain)